MAVAKKWYEYPRPISIDELQQKQMIERYRRENKIRSDWHKKYDRTLTEFTEEKSKCLCTKRDDQKTSMYVCAPDSTQRTPAEEATCCCGPVCTFGNQEPNLRKNICNDVAAATHGREKSTVGNTICCIAAPNPALNPTDTCRKESSSRFRKLKWPPKCNHVCARMGFDCWMC